MNICGTLNSDICEFTPSKSRENAQYSEKKKTRKRKTSPFKWTDVQIVRLLALPTLNKVFTLIPTERRRGDLMVSALDVPGSSPG